MFDPQRINNVLLSHETIKQVNMTSRDRGSAGSSLTGVTVLCPWARHIYPCSVLAQPRKTRTDLTEEMLTVA